EGTPRGNILVSDMHVIAPPYQFPYIPKIYAVAAFFTVQVVHAPRFPHVIHTTARPRIPHPRHRTRSFRSSTLCCGSSSSRARDVGVSNAVREHLAQSTFTKSPGLRSSILAAYSG